MPERKKQSDADGALAILHQFPRDVVDGREMVGIDGVAEPETIGEHCSANEHRIIVKRPKRPCPGRNIAAEEQRVDRANLSAKPLHHPAFLTCAWRCLWEGSPAWACFSVSKATGTMTSRP